MNEDAYGYANALQASLGQHQEDLQKAQEDMLGGANQLKEKALGVASAVGSRFLTDGTANLLKYGSAKLSQMGLKGASQALEDYQSGGITKMTGGVIQRSLGVGKDLTEPIEGEGTEEGTTIEANAQNPLFDPEADVEPPTFEETAPSPATQATPAEFQAPSNEAITQAGQVEEGLADQVETEPFDANVPFPEVEPGYAEYMASQNAIADASSEVADATDAGSDVVSGAVDSATDAVGGAVDSATSAVSSAVSDTTDIASGAIGDASTAITSGVSTAIEGTTGALEATGLALDSTGVGAVVGVALGIGGVLASIFGGGDSDKSAELPPPPNFSFQAGA
jgi:hypothetical protein